VWADYFRATEENRKSNPKLGLAFGRASDQENNASNAGALIPTDARLVCLSVRSFQATFAWCTSPLVLQMLCRDLSLAGITNLPVVPSPLDEDIVHRTTTAKIEDKNTGRIFLEDLNFVGKECKIATEWAERLAEWVFPGEENKTWRGLFVERFAVVPDSVFDFLTETGTEVSARVRIDDDLKTVSTGQLWNEESLPAETILSGLVCCDRVYSREAKGVTASGLLSEFAASTLSLQIGGKATIGRGRLRCVFTAISEGH
jgi:CRISPR-associated protein Cmr4